MKKSLMPIILMAGLAVVVVVVYRNMNTMGYSSVAISASSTSSTAITTTSAPSNSRDLGIATFGTGCFWCTEAIFQQLQGVQSVTSGYIGGKVKNPTYQQICSGTTGHAEAVQIVFDPKMISFKDLLEVFWKTHDPTTLNKQGNDEGTQYRSAIFYHDNDQKKLAEEYKQKLDNSGAFNRPIVTEITASSEFYPAEKYHQNYFNDNSGQGYCQYVIVPKLEKFRQVFKDKLKKN